MNVGGFILGLLISTPSFGMVTLEKIQAKSNTEFELSFREKLGINQVTTEYFNDIIQLTFKDVSVYPAKIMSMQESWVKKIFAYQYSPKVMRCRFSMNGKADAYQDELKLGHGGKTLFVHFREVPNKSTDKNDNSEVPTLGELDEKSLLKKVLGADLEKSKVVSNDTPPHSSETETTLTSQKVDTEKPVKNLTGGKPLPSLKSSFLKLFGVLGVLLLFALVLKRLKKLGLTQGSGSDGNLVRAIRKFAQNSIGQEEKLIQVISTHHLDAKKSIAVVKIAGRMLVLGISNDAIHLITRITETSSDLDFSDEEWGKSGSSNSVVAPTDSPQFFENILSSEKNKPNTVSGVRSRIKSRLEGLKPL